MILKKQLMRASDAYIRSRGISRARLSTQLFNSGHKLDAIFAGADLNTATWEKSMLWLANHWPADGAPIPKDVQRLINELR
jgi:hypothetical protein